MKPAIKTPNRKTRRERETDEALQKAYAQTEVILSSITSILIGVNQDGLVSHWNAVAEKTFGIRAGRVLGRPFSECGIQWNSVRVLAGIENCVKRNVPVRVDDIEFKRANGQKAFLGVTVIPLKQGAEGSVECLLFGADVTERKRIEQLKDEFVSTVSHELRTPLTVIKEGVSQVLEGILGEINENQRRFLDISLEGIDRLARIVDDLLDISKIEAGKFELRRELVDVVGLAKGVSLAFNYQAQQRSLEIKLCLPGEKGEVYIDKDKIIQVLTNLISNALKFTDKGEIKISVFDRGEAIECAVSDTGRGIPQEDLSKVFGKFQQFSRAMGPGQKGTGLGLAICKGIVELHRGRIWVESKLDEGTTIRFTLPKFSARELFRERIAQGLRDAVRQEASLSVIVFDVENFEAVWEKMGHEKMTALVQNLEDLIKQSLRRQADVALKDTRAILVLLPGTRKDEALMVAGRIQQTFDDYLLKEKLKKEIKIACKVAVFPDDGSTEDELLDKIGAS